jgi:hypothetical protein
MADQLPINFVIPSEGMIASYTGTDIATGQGIGTYYAAATRNSPYYYLVSSPIISDKSRYTFTTALGSAFDGDFDITILKPMTIEGLGYVNISCREASGAGAHTKAIGSILRKVSGGVESDIVSVSEDVVFSSNEWVLVTHRLTIPKTTFAIGDTLRLTITCPQGAAGGFQNVSLYFDPSDVLGTSATVLTTTSKLVVPIKVDL